MASGNTDVRGGDRLGRHARTPGEIPWAGWKRTLKRTWTEAGRDNVGIIAAGVAFLSLLAIFPAIAATFAIYGLVSDPRTIAGQMEGLTSALPQQARDILVDQMRDLSGRAGGALGFGLVASLGLALWSAASGVKSLMTALNIVYGEEEKRGFVTFTLTALVLTVCLILLLIVTLTLVVVIPAVIGFLGLGETVETLVSLLRWPLLAAALTFALAVLYRYGPCRARPEWKWVTWGSGAATLLWVVGSIAFSVYIGNFADYNATYGSMGAFIVLLLWLYLGMYAVLLGAEMDAELEHQTAQDTTTGPDKPMGSRNARMADTVAN